MPIDRFLALIDRRGPAECWPCLGTRNSKRYPYFCLPGGPTAARRLAYNLARRGVFGALTDDLRVGVSCHNRLCMNPSHFETWYDRARRRDNLGGLH